MHAPEKIVHTIKLGMYLCVRRLEMFMVRAAYLWLCFWILNPEFKIMLNSNGVCFRFK